MNKKIFLSFILLSISLGFIFFSKGIKFNAENESKANNKVVENKLTQAEQKKRIDYLKYGKRSEYKCTEELTNTNYGYRIHGTGIDTTDNSEYGKGILVRFCKKGIDPKGYVMQGLIENTEQISFSKDMYGNDTAYNWYIEPRIRIDREAVRKDPWLRVCRIDILNYEGETIREVELDAKNFMNFKEYNDDGYYYSGEYLQQFDNVLPDENLVVSGKELNPNNRKDKGKSKIDYKIYWLGKCDMCLDYVRVENETAHELLQGKYDMWLSAMDNTIIFDLKDLRPTHNQEMCINYIIKKLNYQTIERIAKFNNSLNN